MRRAQTLVQTIVPVTSLPYGLTTAAIIQALKQDFRFRPESYVPLTVVKQKVAGTPFWDLAQENPHKAARCLSNQFTRLGVRDEKLFCWLVGIKLAQRCVKEATELGSVLETLLLATYQSFLRKNLSTRAERHDENWVGLAEAILGDYLRTAEQLVQDSRLWPPCQTNVFPGWREMMEVLSESDQTVCIRAPQECD